MRMRMRRKMTKKSKMTKMIQKNKYYIYIAKILQISIIALSDKSNSELTRHIQIGYYWVKDLIDRDLITIVYCPTEFIFTKPLQGTLFNQMREKVTGISPVWAAIKFIIWCIIYKKFILTILCLIFTINLSSLKNLFLHTTFII